MEFILESEDLLDYLKLNKFVIKDLRLGILQKQVIVFMD